MPVTSCASWSTARKAWRKNLCDGCRRLDHHAADRLRFRRAGRTPAGLAAWIAGRCATDLSANLPSPWRSRPIVRSSSSVKWQAPGQYPYVPNMTAESAIAIAGGFTPRARRDSVTVTHTDASAPAASSLPPGTPISAPAIPSLSASAGSHPADRNITPYACQWALRPTAAVYQRNALNAG